MPSLRPPLRALLLAFTAVPAALAADVPVQQWQPQGLPYGELSELEGACPYAGPITWLPVGTAGCTPPGGRGPISANEVWCFEAPDSLWPAGPTDVRHTWRHWAWHDPPVSKGSRWHVSGFRSGPANGTYNAWCGCDASGSVPACEDVAFWKDGEGYGDGWEEALRLDLSALGGGSGGSVSFDLRYDVECTYDYLYLEYYDPGTSTWNILLDGGGTAAVFNGVSGHVDPSDPCDEGTGGALDGNYFDTSGEAYHGLSIWYSAVTFPLPSVAGLMLRWRGSSDKSWSDQDGRGDTEGMAAIDNVVVTFNNGDTVSDDFENGDFSSALVNGVPDPTVWSPETAGSTYDGWHLSFDPMYKNKNATCNFSDDWMWLSKPDVGAIQGSGFRFLLVSPQIPVSGWTGAVVSYSEYLCANLERDDVADQLVRYYDSGKGLWSPWANIDGVAIDGGCTEWNLDQCLDLTSFLGASVDTLQVAFEMCDVSTPTEFSWGKHGTVAYIIDDVSIGSFSGAGPTFQFARTDLFHDTFSLSDPAHTAHLGNDEQGDWVGSVGTRPFEDRDKLSVEVKSSNGMATGTVDLWWRANGGAWNSKPMSLSMQTGGPGEGVYRAIIGDDSGAPPEDQTGGSDGLIWNPGQLVEYYLEVVDDGLVSRTLPAAASFGSPRYFEFRVLPFGWDNGKGETLLIVNDYVGGLLDYPKSTGWLNPGFSSPVCDEPADLIAEALDVIYDPSATCPDPKYEIYTVLSAGSDVQTEPRGFADPALGLGGLMDIAGNPQYDAIFWVNGDLVCRSFELESRLDLMTYLDNGGNLLASGDNIAHDLGSGGCDTDAVTGFLPNYLGASFPTSTDDATSVTILDAEGVGGVVLPGLVYGIYGDCPKRRRFDRLTLAVPSGGPFVSSEVIMEYTNGGASDNGRPAMILCDRDNSVPKNHHAAVLMGFDLSAFTVLSARTDLMNEVIVNCFGLAETDYEVVGSRGGVGAPGESLGAAFALMRPWPNPMFGREAVVRFAVGRAGPVELAVFDVLGRRVRTLEKSELEAREYRRFWDGRDDAGVRVGSGVYFYRLKADGFQQVRKITWVR